MEHQKKTGYFLRMLFRLYIYLKNKFDPRPPVREEETLCSKICKNLIFTEESKLTFAPLSAKRFIKNDDKDMFIVIENRTISIINHIYSYNVFFEDLDLYEQVLRDFDNELEKRRMSLESEIRKNIKHSLENILSKTSKNSLSKP